VAFVSSWRAAPQAIVALVFDGCEIIIRIIGLGRPFQNERLPKVIVMILICIRCMLSMAYPNNACHESSTKKLPKVATLSDTELTWQNAK